MRSADGHRAEDWNLAKPLNTCSLEVVRRDNDLCINIMAERPKKNAPPGAMESYLFAQSNIQVEVNNPAHKIEHWVNPVVDSSRYFAVRIKDSKSGREAFIGVGFRERTDATNFRMSIEDYINSLKREEKAARLHEEFEQSLTLEKEGGGGDADSVEKLPLPKSSLSLKEGEKLHINIKSSKQGGANTSYQRKSSKGKAGTGGGGLLGLKKPPPPPDNTTPPVSDTSSDQGSIGAKNATSEEQGEVDWGDFEG